MIDNAEDRHKFSSILDSIGVDQPDWVEVTSLEAAKEFANKVTSVQNCSLFFRSLIRTPADASFGFFLYFFTVTLSLSDPHMSFPVPP